MPSRCVLNGLQVVEIPAELSGLDCLSKQFIQRAKAYQTEISVGTYTAKVPMYNSLKACKGVMFFLPLPLEKTLDTFGEVDNNVSLASPELYIIVNGKPTKTKVVWHSLVDSVCTTLSPTMTATARIAKGGVFTGRSPSPD